MPQMELAEWTYSHRSICSCGFPALRETVPLGKVYRVIPASVGRGEWGCGGCGRLQRPLLVLAENDDGSFGGLPVGIFETGAQDAPH